MTKIEQIAQVAARLKGLRDALELTTDQIAKDFNITEETYIAYESGNMDIPINFLQMVASRFNVELHALLFNEDPRMKSYFVTRAGKGIKVERTAAYSYQSLAAGFKNRCFDPMLVTVEPSDKPITLNSHEGQEWCHVIEGRLLIRIGNKEKELEVGDSIMFDSTCEHGMKALDGNTVKFITVIS